MDKSIDIVIAAPPLPSWLTDFVPITDEPDPGPDLLEQSLDARDPRKMAKSKEESLHDQFARRLAPHTGVEDIKSIVQELGLDLQKFPQLSSLAFKRLLENKTSYKRLLRFLKDPILNVTAAQNLLQYVQHLNRRASSHSELATLRQYIKQAVTLGLVSENEITLILTDDVEDCVPREFGGTLPKFSSIGFVRAIWDGLQQSSVFTAGSLHGRTLGLILYRLDLIDGEHRSLALSIVAEATPAQLVHMIEGISYSLLAWYQYGKVREVNSRPGLDFNNQKLHRGPVTVPGLTEYIDSLPENVVRSSLVAATKILLSRRRYFMSDSAQAKFMLMDWMNLLSQSALFRSLMLGSPEWETLERQVTRGTQTKNAITYLMVLSELDQCKFIVRNWVYDLVRPRMGLEPAKVCSAVMRTFDQLCRNRGLAQCYNNLILALYYEDQLHEPILHATFRLLRELSRSDKFLQIVELLQACDIPMKAAILGAEAKQYSQIDTGVALRIFELHQALTLEGCLDLAIALINDPLSHVDTTFRLLNRHRPTTDKPSKATRPRFHARTHLLHQMATAFAHAEHLNPSIAFRKVHECYVHLQRDELPVGPALVRALTHAGIVRNLQAGDSVGTQKIQWILGRVREVEGEDVEKVVDGAIFTWRGKVNAYRLQPQRQRTIRDTLRKEIYAAAGDTFEGWPEDPAVWSHITSVKT